MDQRRSLCDRRRVRQGQREAVPQGLPEIIMNIEEIIRERLARLAPESLEVFDDSRAHAGHAGAKDGGGHYQLVIVSREFAGKNAVARHRLIYEALSDLMPK